METFLEKLHLTEERQDAVDIALLAAIKNQIGRIVLMKTASILWIEKEDHMETSAEGLQ